MMIVGLTGAFASGKSQAAAYFKALGAKVFDADQASRKALSKGTPVYRAAVKLFGEEFLQKNKQFDRRKLAQHVFANPKELKKLITLIHPGVIFDSLAFVESLKNKKGVVVLDVPLLFESKMAGLCDATVVVSAKLPTILKRAATRGVTPALTKKILASQWSLAKKERLADFVVKNDGDRAALKKQIQTIFKKLTSQV